MKITRYKILLTALISVGICVNAEAIITKVSDFENGIDGWSLILNEGQSPSDYFFGTVPDPLDATNLVLRIDNISGLSDSKYQNTFGYKTLPSAISSTSTADTFFFRIYATGTGLEIDSLVGLTHLSEPVYNGYSDLKPILRFSDINGPSVDVRDGGIYTQVGPLIPGKWHDIWYVMDSTAQAYDVYIEGGYWETQTRVAEDISFRNTENADIATVFLGNQDFPDSNVGYALYDDFYYMSGENLSNPTAVPEPRAFAVLSGIFVFCLVWWRRSSVLRAQLN